MLGIAQGKGEGEERVVERREKVEKEGREEEKREEKIGDDDNKTKRRMNEGVNTIR